MTMFDGTSEIWNVHDGSVIRRIKHDGVRRMTLSLDLQRLAVITMRNSGGTEQLLEDVLEVQDFNLNKTLWTRKLKKRESLGMKISPDNEWLAVCYRTEVELYALGGSMLRAWPLQLDPNAENCEISFSTDVTLLSLLSYPDSDRVWVFDLRTGSHYKSPELDEVWGSWVAVGAGETLYIYDRAQRRLLRRVELPNKESLVMITVSPDDLKIAVHAVGRMWLLDVRALLAENWQSNTSEEPTYHLSNNAQLMASVLNTVIEVKDAITGRILSTLDLDKAGWQCTINKLAFSPDGQCIAFSGNKSVIVWNRADDKLQYYDFDDAELIRHLAISPNANSDDQWLAVCGMFGISVWGMTSGDFVRFTRPPDHFFRGEPTFVGFSGSRLGVLWCEYYAEVRAPDATFSLYNIKTGERLSRIDIPWTSSRWPVSRARFSISPNGKLAMSYVPEKKNLLITDLETGTHCVSVHIEAYHFFFVDDNTVSTDQGLFHLTSVIARTMEELAASTDQLVRIDAGTRWTLPTIHPTFETYGRSSNFEWITLDNQPLLWIPPQYRKVRQELMAIGYDHVTVEFSRGMYSIAFEQVARDFVRKARNSLS
ncbi:hypothetical protein NW762_013375 [Fusarium torreyae]|uniref:WD40 repeat domain-containing protein n=1 Tax=Fusarium torreyae TaxID=1237075 RepID=A0A9W8RMA0_9HYPO|nr:hypothetical protein NW762_013375 [Fusarium torreyae]